MENMRNNWHLDGDIAYADIKRSKQLFRVIVDEANYEVVSSQCWFINNGGYAVAIIGGRKVRMHRLLTSAANGLDVDHINHNRTDNRLTNLRVCTRSDNRKNGCITRKNTSSGLLGVYWDKEKQRWKAAIRVDGRLINLGRYKTKQEARSSREKAEALYFGEFASTGGST